MAYVVIDKAYLYLCYIQSANRKYIASHNLFTMLICWKKSHINTIHFIQQNSHNKKSKKRTETHWLFPVSFHNDFFCVRKFGVH